MIFEPDLDLDQIAWAAGFEDDPEIFVELRDEIGQPAWSYLRDGRLETAARLLLETSISVAEIGRLVGYASVTTFRGRLRSFLGMSASAYRRRAPRILERGGEPPDGAQTEQYWERMLAGELSDGEARALERYLARLAGRGAEKPDAEAERWSRLREALADAFVLALKHLSLADRRRLARDAIWFPDLTFFEQLSRRSHEAAADRDDDGDPARLLDPGRRPAPGAASPSATSPRLESVHSVSPIRPRLIETEAFD